MLYKIVQHVPPKKLYNISYEVYKESSDSLVTPTPLLRRRQNHLLEVKPISHPQPLIKGDVPIGYKIFGNIAAAAYMEPEIRQDYLNSVNLTDYIIQTDISDEQIIIIKNDKLKQFVICYRGTQLDKLASSYEDIKSDLLIGLSIEQIEKRYKESLNIASNLSFNNPDFTFITTGHSLGAYLSYEVSKELRLESFNFALPSSLFQLTTTSKAISVFNRHNFKNLHIYSVLGDPIGEMGMLSSQQGDKHYLKPKRLNLHSVLNYV